MKMKKIGLVGGTSWASTIDYYRIINEGVNERLGGLNFAECIIYSVNFEDFRRFNAAHNWDGTYELLAAAALNLKKAGADLLLLGANTGHIVADRIAETVKLPLIDIRVATARAIHARGLKKLGLLGTKYTMELDFYKDTLRGSGLEVIIPGHQADRDFIEETLLYELGKGIITEKTKLAYLQLCKQLIAEGAEGIILGCTEIPLIIQQEDLPVPVFNTTLIHSMAAVDYALQEAS